MGSLRRPVGPLPSSIYWRRRLVLGVGVALLVLLLVWALTSVGGGGDDTEATGDDHAGGPAESITPGPTPSESFIDERPGGREEPEEDPDETETDAEGGDGGDGGTGETGGSTGGAGGESGADGGTGDTGGSGSGGSGGSDDVSGLPACTPAEVSLSLRSVANEYGLDEEPELVVEAANTSSVSCAVDFGFGALTVTITDADAEEVWSSVDCPQDPAALPTAVAAGATATHTIDWDRHHSTGDCDVPPGAEAAAGSYLAEAALSGHSDVPQAPFRLDND